MFVENSKVNEILERDHGDFETLIFRKKKIKYLRRKSYFTRGKPSAVYEKLFNKQDHLKFTRNLF